MIVPPIHLQEEGDKQHAKLANDPASLPDFARLVLTLAVEAGISEPRAWGDGVSETLRLVGLRLPARENRKFELFDARQVKGAELHLVSYRTHRRVPPGMCREDPSPWFLPGTNIGVTPDIHLVSLQEGYLVQFGHVPVVVAGDRRSVVRNASSRYAPLVHFAPFDLAAALGGAREIQRPVFLLGDDLWPSSYSHWVLDTLPRLALLELVGRWSNAVIATPPLTEPFQRETLRLCGWDDDRIVEVGPMQALRARELLVTTDQPEPPHPMFKGAPWAARYLRQHLGVAMPFAGKAEPATGRRLYLSRADARWRRVLNEAALISTLAARGFESVSLRGMSVREQAGLFDAAAWIVAPHGAGLANIVFARPNATILELFPRTFGGSAFYFLAASQGLRYGCHVVPETAVARREEPGFDDMYVDPELLINGYADLLPG